MKRDRELNADTQNELSAASDEGLAKRPKMPVSEAEVQDSRHGFYTDDSEEDDAQLKRVTACACNICEPAIQARLDANHAKASQGPAGPKTVTCLCEEGHDDEEMVYCYECKTWQHFECYYSGEEQKELLDPDFEHYCQECRPWPSSDDEENEADSPGD